MLRYGYFDSDIIGVDDEGMPIFDRAELSDLFALLFASLVSDGVLALPATCFKIQAVGNGLTIERLPGFGMVKGHFCYDDESEIMTLNPAPQKYSRIDRVIMRLNLLERMVEIVIKQGIEAAKPQPPGLIRPSAGDYYELCLANIRLSAGQKIITQSSITDTRADSTVCGFITHLIDHLDTAVFFEQLNKFYEEFVDKSNGSYDKFVSDMGKYLKELMASGNSQLEAIVKLLANFESASEQQWDEWFGGIQNTLTSVENGKMLAEILRLIEDLYEVATPDDIDQIIDNTYVDSDNEGSIFETGTNQDIDDIINGTYIDTGEPDGGSSSVTEQNMTDIVNNAFREE